MYIGFGCTVQRRRGFVKEEYRRVLEYGAGNCDTLFFTTGEFQTSLTDAGLIARGQLGNKVVNPGCTRGFVDMLFVSARITVGNVVIDCIVEQNGILRDYADSIAERRLCDFVQVETVDRNSTGIRLVKSQQQTADRRLAGARGTDNGYLFSRFHLKADTVQNYPLRIVAEVNIGEPDITPRCAQGPRTRQVLDLRYLFQEGKHVLHIDQRLPYFTIYRTKKIKRNGQLHQISVHHNKSPNSHRAITDVQGSHDQHNCDTGYYDGRLANIQERQAFATFDCGLLISF